MHIAPDAARILWQIGLWEEVTDKANILKSESAKRWQNKEIGTMHLMPKVRNVFSMACLYMSVVEIALQGKKSTL